LQNVQYIQGKGKGSHEVEHRARSWSTTQVTVTNLTAGCHYFPPGQCLPSQPQWPSTGTKLYYLMTETHRC